MSIGLEFRPNRLYYGDCLDVLREWPAQCVDLVYLDPPFNSKANYNVLYGSTNGASAQLRAFSDTWHWDEAAARRIEAVERAPARRSHGALTGLRTILGESGMLAYLSYMAERLEQCRHVLRNHGSLYLHCDPTASHYLKVMLDAIFGAKQFRNEIVWRRATAKGLASTRLASNHDVLFCYGKTTKPLWHPTYTGHDPAYIEKSYRHVEAQTGRRYRLDNLTNPNKDRRNLTYEFLGVTRVWRWTKERMIRAYAQGHIVQTRPGGVPSYKRYLDEQNGRAVDDLWTDIAPLQAKAQERIGYPTQKPVALLDRIIRSSSNELDIVLDPFCGCGTTIAAADLAKRQWVGIDISPFAVKLVRDRRLRPMGRTAEIAGIPTDMEGARMLLERNAFDFEAWAVTAVPGLAPNERQVGDRGIDGRGAMMHVPDGTESRLVLAQVKGGGYTASSMRDFQRVIERENAAAGIYITLERVQARSARQTTSELGTFTIGAQRYPRLQLWSIEELLDDREPHLPDMADPYTGERIRQAELFG